MADARRAMSADVYRGAPFSHLDAYITALELPEDAADALRLWAMAQTDGAGRAIKLRPDYGT